MGWGARLPLFSLTVVNSNQRRSGATVHAMRVLAAPDSFTGTMTAAQAAASLRDGWLETWPGDTVVALPISDGGPGFVDAIVAARGARRVPVTVTGPLGVAVSAEFAIEGHSAWIESAAACGLHLVPADQRNPLVTTTFGVGELIAAAIEAGATHVTVGLGGSGTNDGGAGTMAALGATCATGTMDRGGAALRDVRGINLEPALRALDGCTVVVATDVDNHLTGLRGATNVFARQKGADDSAVQLLDAALESFAEQCGRLGGKDPSVALGAGAAGGLGYGLMRLGAIRVAGISTVLDELAVHHRILDTDLVLTGEGCLDDQSLHGKAVAGIARLCAESGVPCVAIAGEVRLGKRELAAAGIDGAYALRELVGPDMAMAEPTAALHQVAARVARTWGRRP